MAPISSSSSSDVLVHVERILPDLPDTLSRGGYYMLENRHRVAAMNIAEVIKSTGVSKASVIRFCQALGFQGFRDFKQAVIGELLPRPNGHKKPESSREEGDWEDALADPGHFLTYLAQSVAAAVMQMNSRTFATAVKAAAQARLLVWYGTGDSGFIAASGDHRCMINGINSRVINMPESLISITKSLSAADFLICITRSGRTASVLEPIRWVRQEAPCQLLVITGDPGSPVARLADFCLPSTPIDLYVDSQRTTMQVAQMGMVDAFINALLRAKYASVTTVGLAKRSG